MVNVDLKGVVVYATKYGSTREYAEAIGIRLGLPVVQCGTSADKSRVIRESRVMVLGSPVYGHSVLRAMKNFLLDHSDGLCSRKLAAFVVAGDTAWNPRAGEGGWKNLKKLKDLLPVEPFATAIFGGRLRIEELDAEDRMSILSFYERLGREATGFDLTELSAVEPFCRDVLSCLAETARDF